MTRFLQELGGAVKTLLLPLSFHGHWASLVGSGGWLWLSLAGGVVVVEEGVMVWWHPNQVLANPDTQLGCHGFCSCSFWVHSIQLIPGMIPAEFKFHSRFCLNSFIKLAGPCVKFDSFGILGIAWIPLDSSRNQWRTIKTFITLCYRGILLVTLSWECCSLLHNMLSTVLGIHNTLLNIGMKYIAIKWNKMEMLAIVMSHILNYFKGRREPFK